MASQFRSATAFLAPSIRLFCVSSSPSAAGSNPAKANLAQPLWPKIKNTDSSIRANRCLNLPIIEMKDGASCGSGVQAPLSLLSASYDKRMLSTTESIASGLPNNAWLLAAATRLMYSRTVCACPGLSESLFTFSRSSAMTLTFGHTAGGSTEARRQTSASTITVVAIARDRGDVNQILVSTNCSTCSFSKPAAKSDACRSPSFVSSPSLYASKEPFSTTPRKPAFPADCPCRTNTKDLPLKFVDAEAGEGAEGDGKLDDDGGVQAPKSRLVPDGVAMATSTLSPRRLS
mmetsp:Transcript_24632/g.56860  ORF Transcript_24632/g.56860 Transcript_24632/m.56860 type:complete len:289 (+) Transcript_24632:779-1645(+)